MTDLIIQTKRFVSRTAVGPASIHISDGRVERIAARDDVHSDCEVIDYGELAVMPGNVDAHVHVNEPGRTEWEGFETATRAAAAGGVTTIVDMPLNSIPPTTTLAGFEEKLAAAKGQCTVDVAFWGGAVPGNTDEIAPLVRRGVRGFKCFLIHSGVDEFPHVSEDELRVAMQEVEREDSVLLVHAEVAGPIDAAAASLAGSNTNVYETFLRSRPNEAETQAIALVIELSRETGCRTHIVHLSSAEALPMLRAAKKEGLSITAETCPHYLTFAAENIENGATQFKCCPPVRERENREKLWEAIGDGTLDMVVSDHSPCTPALKLPDSGDFMAAWGGISALQLGLPVMWTQLNERGFALPDLTRLMAERPAQLASLGPRKGRLQVGYDADIVVWDPEAQFTIAPELIHHRHKVTPYSGMELFGKVEVTYSRGRKVYENGSFVTEGGGELIT
jgi:allantoinase